MPQYKVQIPGQGVFNIESPQELTDEQAYMAVMRELAPKPEPAKPAEPTLGGQVKEFAKGVIPGAIGMGQTALTGLAALLPQEQEDAARKILNEGAETLKRPFAAAPGYEETIGRKFGESVGSIGPFLALGPLGAAGRVGMVGLGVGAGAGEARIRAEQEGATPEQRSSATALGTIPGALEAFAPMQILGRLSAPIQQGIMASVKRALIAGGEEAAQEAASQIAQNLIAKGVYKPDQAIIEQVGESAAYGGATGALVQGILDMAIGRRAKAAPKQQPQQGAAQTAEQVAQQVAPTAEAATLEQAIAEPTLRGEEAPEDIGKTPLSKAEAKKQAAQAKRLAEEQAAFLKQYEEQAALREQQAAEYERIKAMTPEEYALEQMQGIKAKKVKPTSQEDLNAQLAELGYQTEPTPPAPPVVPGADYAAQQIKLAKDREPIVNNELLASYLMQNPEQAREVVQNQTPIPGVSQKDSAIILGGLKLQLAKYDKKKAADEAARVSTARGRAAELFQREPEDLIGAARQQPAVQAQEVVKAEREGLERIGQRPATYLTANRDVETQRKLEAQVDQLVDTLPRSDRSIAPGDVYLGLGTRKQDVRDLQAQLAVARMTRNRDLQQDLKRQIDAARERQIPTEGGLGTEGGKTAAEFISRSKLPEFQANEVQGDKFAAEQRSTLLGMARLLASPKIMLPATKEKMLREEKEKYVAQHAAEIEARRKAFGLPPMADWEIAEARARALEGLNTLTNNWGQFEDPVISVKALQNITREAVYQNIFKAAQRKAQEEEARTEPTPKGTRYTTVGGQEMFIPAETGPRIGAPAELTLKGTPRRAGDTKQDAINMVTMALTRQNRVSPTEVKQAAKSVGSLDELANLFKKAEVGGTTVEMEPATISLLEQLRDALPASTDPEFHALAREQAQRIVEGNLPNPNAVRELGDMLTLQEQGKRSETRPGATSEDLQRTSAQPQRELFPEASVQTLRATPANFQKMLDSKNVQGMREALAQAKEDNKAALEQIKKYVPSIQKELRSATEALEKAKAKAETLTASAAEQLKEPKWYAPAVRQIVEFETLLQGVPKRLEALRGIQRSLKGLNAQDRADLVQLATEARKTAGAPDIVEHFNDIIKAAQNPASLDAEIKMLNNAVINANNMLPAARKKLDDLMTSYQNDVVLRRSLDRQAKKAVADVEAATKRLREAQKAYREELEKSIKAETKPDELAPTPDEVFKKAAQAGREGLGLEGERIERDTLGLREEENGLRSKIGSLEDQMLRTKSEKRKAQLQEQIDETEAELAALPEKAPVERKTLGERTDADIAFEKEQLAQTREKNKELELATTLPNRVVGLVAKNTRTGRVTQEGKRRDIVGASQEVTNALIARRAELAELNRRKDFLESKGKAVPRTLTADIKKAEKAVNTARNEQNKIAAEELATRKAFRDLQGKRIAREAKRFSEADEENRMARGVETVSPDLSPAQVSMLKKNDLTGALDSFADDKDTSKLNKIVAQRLAAMLDNTNIKLVDNLKDNEGRSALGMATSKLITLDRKTGLSQEVLLHEGTHAATERVLVQYERDPSQLTEIQRVAVRELKALHKAIQNDPRITSASAKGSLSEFVAEVFSNRNLQEQLRQKKWRLSDAWKGFKSIIMRMLGINNPETMLGAALQSVDALMIPSSQRTKLAESAVNRQLSQKDIAALHTGSNSMKQFAEAFGTTHIKQKDRTAEDANRIGQEYLDDMYANPLDYVAPADRLDYSVRTSDGKPFDMDNALHYVEADAADFAMLKAQEDPELRKREASAITANRKKDLKALVKNLGDSGEFTYVEQALVAKAASKYAVLSDKSGKLKLAAIEPNNRHDIAVVSAADAGRIIEELRAGKPLKQAFLDGMQKNANENAKNNQRKNGWQKFDQVTGSPSLRSLYTQEEIDDAWGQTGYEATYFENDDELIQQLVREGLLPKRKFKKGTNAGEQAAIELNAACAGTPWCTGATVGTARSQIEAGDFYVYYQNGRPEVAVRMDGKNQIGEVRGNSPNQALNKEQEAIARSFLQENKFEGADTYLKEFDNRKFVVELLKGETDYSLEQLFENPPSVDADGKVEDRAVKKLLSFRTLDGYSGRPKPTDKIINEIRQRIQTTLNDAERMGYYPTKDAKYKNGQFLVGDKRVPIDEVKGVRDLTIYSSDARELNYTVPNLEYVHNFSPFTDFSLPKAKYVAELSFFSDATVTLPKDADVGLVRSANRAKTVLKGPERIRSVQLLDSYGDTNAMDLTLPDTKYVTVVPPRGTPASRIKYRIRDILQQAGIDSKSDPKVYRKALQLLGTKLGKGVYDDIFEKGTKDFAAGDLDEYIDLFADSILEREGFNDAKEASAERQTAANNIAKKINAAWELEDYKRLGEEGGTLIAPKRVEETFTEAEEQPRYAKAQATGFEDELSVASELIAKPKTIREKVEANLGLSFRTQFLDRLAPLEKVANEMLDPLRGTQMMYYLRMADQKMSFVQQAVGRGVPQLVDVKRADGQTERLIESKKGPNLAEVVTTLKEAPGMNAEAANQLFTLYLAGKRGDRVGYDKLNFGVPEAQIKSAIAKIEGNKELRDVFEKAREQYNAYNRDLMKFMEQTGALTPEEAKRLASTNDYIPYYREENGNAVLVIGGEGTYKIGSLAEQPQLRQLIGGSDKILDFLTSSVQNTSMLLDMGLRNQATKNAMFELADLKLAQFLGGTPSGPDIVRFKDKGVDKYVRINTDELGIPADLLVKGMEGIPVNNSALVRTMGGFSTLLRRSITVSPLYAARQLFRDSLAAPLLSGANFTPVMGALRQLGKSDTRETLEARGIVGGQVFTGTNEDLTRILGELQAGKMGLSQFIARAEAIAMEADALTRRAQYDSYIEQGLSQMEATLMSLESMNFNRKGLSPSVRLATQLIPFFNAQVQSLDVLYRAMTGKMPMNERLQIQEKLFKRGALLAGTAVAYALLMQDDDTYKNAQPDEKYGNFFVHVPGISETIRVPVPFEIGYIFKGIPEAMVNIMANERGAEEAYKAFKNIAIQTIPGGSSALMPAAVKPLVENLTNYSFFTGRSLETRAEQMEKSEFRYRDNTSELAKQVGALTGVSPIKIENLIRGYTGGMGLALAQALNFSMPTAGSPEQATKRLSDAAVIGPLFQPADAGGQVSAVYDRISDIAETKRTYDKLVKEGRMADARALVQDDVEKFSKYAVAGNVQEQLGKITQAMNAIKASTLSADEKREQLDKLQALRIQIANAVRGAL